MNFTSERNLAKGRIGAQSTSPMKSLLPFCSIATFLFALATASVAKPLPTDPVERAKALERYKEGLKLYTKGQKLHREGKYEDANATYGQALDLFQDGPKPDVANSYNSLGNAYLNKEPRTALWYYAKALKVRIREHGQEHETVGSSYNNVGLVCMKMEEYDRAIAYFNGAMGIFQRISTKRHDPHVAANHIHLGSAYAAKEMHDESVMHHEKGLEIFLKVFGERHPNIARAKRDLGYALVEQGTDKKRAKAILLESKELFIATKGANHEETQEVIQRIAKLR